ncbi:hypothetical protein AEP_00551 [Curvibacter sp. AEP1-3]|uniref:hypothetical protein n=1 Tax=Curvibacter sp. AEP1-3 TaxID=1844971 RepID=UPI000B3C5A03|nr:hypothetical protein [Curvibacter sp. AEP1-3]ARV17511.1 hypothetical protein AEP_00551 [Curvibacter sp. AEP1-3]
MRKTSAYARKQRRLGGVYNGAEGFNVIQRCRQYTPEPLPGMESVAGTQSAADKSMILVREAYLAMKNNACIDPVHDFDVLAHAIGVAWIRAVKIAGEDEFTNTMLPILKTANEALGRSKERFHRIGRMGFDGPAIDQVEAGIEVYEAIVSASSPAQMTEAVEERSRILKGQQ